MTVTQSFIHGRAIICAPTLILAMRALLVAAHRVTEAGRRMVHFCKVTPCCGRNEASISACTDTIRKESCDILAR
jgi:hypothetical protein